MVHEHHLLLKKNNHSKEDEKTGWFVRSMSYIPNK